MPGTWQDYREAALDEIDDTETRVASTWKKALAAILAWELWLRLRTRNAAARLPIVAGGWIDWTQRQAVRRFRRGVIQDAQRARDGIILDLGGGTDPLKPTTSRTPIGDGIAPEAIRETIAATAQAMEMLRAIEAAAASEPPAAPPSAATAAGEPPEDPVQPFRERSRELDDEEEVGLDSIINILRNATYELHRFVETITGRLSSRFTRTEDILAYVDGGRDGQPWQLNRNNMNLSVTAHIRGAHRRRTISEASNDGIQDFRIEVPRDRIGDVSSGSFVASQLYQTRSLAEWQDIAADLNRGRVAASTFDTLGFHYADFSYVVPVPAVFAADARKDSRTRRRREAVAA